MKNQTFRNTVITTLCLVAVMGLSSRLTQSRPPAPPYVPKYNVAHFEKSQGPRHPTPASTGGIYVPVTLVPDFDYATGNGSQASPLIVYAGDNNSVSLPISIDTTRNLHGGEYGKVLFYVDITSLDNQALRTEADSATVRARAAASGSATVSKSPDVTLGSDPDDFDNTFRFNVSAVSQDRHYSIVATGNGSLHRFSNTENPLYITVIPKQ